MFSFNFPAFTQRDSSLITRAKRTSFMQKVVDTIYILTGGASYSDGETLTSIEVGLLDYFLFPLKLVMYGSAILFDWLLRTKPQENPHSLDSIKSLKMFLETMGATLCLGISFAAFLSYTLVVSFFVAASLPFVGIIHAISQYKGGKLKEALIKNDENNKNNRFIDDMIQLDRGRDYYALYEPIILDDEYRIDAIRFITLKNGEIAKAVFLSYSRDGHSGQFRYLLFRCTPEGFEAFEAFKELNIANYENFALTHPVLTETSEVKLSSEAQVLTTMKDMIRGVGLLQKGLPDDSEPLPSEMVDLIVAFGSGVEEVAVRNAKRFFRQINSAEAETQVKENRTIHEIQAAWHR